MMIGTIKPTAAEKMNSNSNTKCKKGYVTTGDGSCKSDSSRRLQLVLLTITMAQLSLFLLTISCTVHSDVEASSLPTTQQAASTCKRELLSANKTLAQWAETLENMVTESKIPAANRESIHKAANQVLDSIEDFGHRIEQRPPAQLAKDLVTIRRQSNRMALEIYLHTLDMRWPQTSLQLGITVERVQQACLDRHAIQALETEPNPVETLKSLKL